MILFYLTTQPGNFMLVTEWTLSLGKGYSSSQRPRPGSPFSTDSNTSAAHSQNQKARPTKKHKGGRLDQAPMPHRREGIADGECVDTN